MNCPTLSYRALLVGSLAAAGFACACSAEDSPTGEGANGGSGGLGPAGAGGTAGLELTGGAGTDAGGVGGATGGAGGGEVADPLELATAVCDQKSATGCETEPGCVDGYVQDVLFRDVMECEDSRDYLACLGTHSWSCTKLGDDEFRSSPAECEFPFPFPFPCPCDWSQSENECSIDCDSNGKTFAADCLNGECICKTKNVTFSVDGCGKGDVAKAALANCGD